MIMHTNKTKRKSRQKKMKKIYHIKYGSYVRTLFKWDSWSKIDQCRHQTSCKQQLTVQGSQKNYNILSIIREDKQCAIRGVIKLKKQTITSIWHAFARQAWILQEQKGLAELASYWTRHLELCSLPPFLFLLFLFLFFSHSVFKFLLVLSTVPCSRVTVQLTSFFYL